MCALPEVIALGHTCRDLRPVAFRVAQYRFESLELPRLLQRSKAVITGSAALAMLFEPATVPRAPGDLNLIAPVGGVDLLAGWLVDNGYTKVQRNRVNQALYPYIRSFSSYTFGFRSVTVSESLCTDVMDLIVNCPSTGDMTMMTGGGIVTLYPRFTLSHAAMLSRSGERADEHQVLIGCMASGYISNHDTSEITSQLCGSMCVSTWRHAATDEALLCMQWDQRYSIAPLVKSSNADWRIAARCRNPLCSNYSASFNVDAEIFTARPLPVLSYDIGPTINRIQNHKPPHGPSYNGLLYATLCTEPVIVPVPVCVGVRAVRSMFNLDVDYWVKQRGSRENTAHRSHLQLRFECIPNEPSTTLDYSYTVFLEDPRSFPAYNILANSIAPPSDRENPYYGNILVMKQVRPQDGLFKVIDMCNGDVSVANGILQSMSRLDDIPHGTKYVSLE
ncbi:hypothetical protein BJ138DRAFT_1107425 [Hygrophoropsis aurantiaca]|uniref:Uncharacterized protein n=1 Tax=Hygrophoropsis aurantiaca TaxID=72124 RepID=A0ACB7ZTR2_9AGAM|nr:hypothetical protein BJ138DRAFT_1107425 [Hygrophoropsis aurantiaca]